MNKFIYSFLIVVASFSPFVGEAANSCMMKELGSASDTIQRITYSPDGKSISYQFIDGENVFVIKDKKNICKGYDSCNGISYSFDSKEFAFAAMKDGKSLIVKGKTIISSDSYGYIYSPLYSPYNNSFAFVAQKDNTQFVVKDGKEYGPYTQVILNASSPYYSPDGKDVSFDVVTNDGEKRITIHADGSVVDDMPIDSDYASYPEYSLDGKNTFVVDYDDDGLSVLMKNDKIVSKGYDEIRSLSFSFDGGVYAFNAESAGKTVVISNGNVISSKYASAASPVVSRDGSKIAFISYKNGKYLVVQQECKVKKNTNKNYK